ncbi:hypothetical protein [Haladaptatus sp. DYSN1]|uniref:hypothetical protein n=1 Tax=unclassified Haladaptatus TaxID=2622732 RepID=UPI002404E9F5|nr:hypothetical protein [Haladaptatus sp. DYSN1]
MINRLTFGRNVSFAAEFAVATIPLLFASTLQTPLRLFVGLDEQIITTIAILTSIFSFGMSLLVLTKVGQSTYSPKLHEQGFIFTSGVLYFLFSILITYLGYLLLIYPYSGQIIPETNDIFAGIVISSLYLIALSGVNVLTVWSLERRRRKGEMVSEFLRVTENLREADLAEARELGDRTLIVGRKIEEELRKEPMNDTIGLHTTLKQWLDDFQQFTASDQRKMVGWTSESYGNRSKHWNSYYTKYTDIHKELSKLEMSS